MPGGTTSSTSRRSTRVVARRASHGDLVVDQGPFPVDGDLGGQLRVAGPGQAGHHQHGQGGRDRHQLGPAQGQPGQQRQGGHPHVGGDLGVAGGSPLARHRPGRERTAAGSASGGGVGTCSSSSATTSSVRTRRTHSSGRRIAGGPGWGRRPP